MTVFFAIFFFLYSLVNYYLFIRGWQALSIFPKARIIYLIAFILLSLSYLIGKIFIKYLPQILYNIFTYLGAFWFAFLLYFFLIIVFVDAVRVINYFFSIYPEFVKLNYQKVKFYVFAFSLIITTGYIIYGYVNARILKVKEINITLPEKSSSIKELNVVQISDIHISAINDGKFLKVIVDKVNSLSPDIILIPGDLVDERAAYLEANGYGKSFANLKSKYGVYATTGNHEFINGAKEVVNYLSRFNIKWIDDELILIDNKFYIAGRFDTSIHSFTRANRKPLAEIMQNKNLDYPVILLDHTPFKLEEAEQNGIDLQLSGHTHHGQLFPFGFITKAIYEKDWGYLKKNNTQYYISSGVGTWGPPVKTGNDAEIVNIKIKFE